MPPLAQPSSSSSSDSSAVIDDPSETVEVFISRNSSGSLSSRSLTATNESYKGVNELYWYYTAVKQDSYFSTGQSEFDNDGNPVATPLYTDDDGNAQLGLPTDAFGTFSVGTWLFQFYAYEVSTESIDGADTVTIDETTYYIGNLYYSGESYDSESYYTTLTTESNTVSVSVEYVGAESGTGCIVVYGITIKDTSEENEISSLTGSDTTYAVVTLLDSDGNTVSEITDSGIAVMSTTEEDGLYLYYTTTDDDGEEVTSTDIPVGYYGVTVTFYVNGNESATGTAEDVLVQAGHTTTVTGDTLEVTVDAEIGDTNITYYTVSVSTADELIDALALDGATVVLTESVTLDSYLSVTTDSTIDLNGYTITQSSSSTHGVVVYSDDVTLVLTDSSEDGSGSIDVDYYPVYVVGDNADITIEGGTYSSDYIAVYIQGDNETITINDGTFSGPSCIAYSSSTSPDFDLTINGGTFTSTSSAAINLGTNNLESATITITGGTFSGGYYSINVNGNLTSSNNVTIDISGGEFNNEAFLAGYATTTITGGTFTGTDNMQALHVKSGSISITGGTFNHADYGTESYAATDWDYFMTGSGSMNHDEAIVIEANSNCSALTSVTLGNGFTANSGVLYVIDPDYDTSTKGTITESISSDRTDVQQYTITDLIYKRAVSGVGTAYFTSLTNAQSFTSFDYGTPGDLYVYNNGWSVYSE